MTDHVGKHELEDPDAARVAARAHNLTPEEIAAGSDDPELQAETILTDSDERVAEPEISRRESAQTPD